MKYKLIIWLLIVILVSSFVNASVTLPSVICGITGGVLDIKYINKTITDFYGPRNVEYYKLELDITNKTVHEFIYSHGNPKTCYNIDNSSLFIILVQNYEKYTLQKGQKVYITAGIQGDAGFHGFFVGDIEVLEEPLFFQRIINWFKDLFRK